MSRAELIEWLVMILVIVLWWPLVFTEWGPQYYRYPLYVFSAVSLVTILVRRVARMQEGFAVSEKMMRAKIAAEEAARGGKPPLDERQPPDVSDQLPFVAGPSPEDEQDKDERDDGDEGEDEDR